MKTKVWQRSLGNLPKSSRGERPRLGRGATLKAIVIVAATWFVYAPAFHGGWFWDDPSEITGNTALHDWAGLRSIWFAPVGPDYYPLKTTLQWVQWHLWGDSVTGYHLTNVGLHLLSAFLLWHLLRQLGVRLAWLGGLIFAIHPLAVESVAWISELKNVLSLPWLLLAMIFWVDWDEVAQASRLPISKMQTGTPALLCSLACFLAAMLCKSSVVMFPFILLLYAWWERGRIGRRDVLASLPFFAVSLVLGLVSVWFQQNVAIRGIVVDQGGLFSRLAVAGMAMAFYFWKFVWPVGLLPIYPRWAVDPPSLWQFWPWVVIGAVIFGLWKKGRRHLLFGLGFFLINLLPVLGFIPMSFLRISWVADHFAYLPIVGLVGLAAAGIGEVAQASRLPLSGLQARTPALPRIVFGFAVLALIAALAITARRQASIFRSEKAAWTYTLARNPQAWLAHNNLSNILLNEGRVQEAKAQIEDALRLRPDFAEANNNLGNILLQLGQAAEAKPHFERAIRFRENYAEAYNGLGNYYLKTGRPREARAQYEQALKIDPGYTNCRDNLGAALENMGLVADAIAEYQKVLKVDPGFANAHYNLGIALARAGNLPGAIAEYEKALRIDPTLIQACNNLGVAQVAMNRVAEGIATYERALRLNPDYFEAHNNLGNALLTAHRYAEAIVQFGWALRIQPGYAPGRNNLGIALADAGRIPEAKLQFEEALRLDPNDADARRNLERTRHK